MREFPDLGILKESSVLSTSTHTFPNSCLYMKKTTYIAMYHDVLFFLMIVYYCYEYPKPAHGLIVKP